MLVKIGRSSWPGIPSNSNDGYIINAMHLTTEGGERYENQSHWTVASRARRKSDGMAAKNIKKPKKANANAGGERDLTLDEFDAMTPEEKEEVYRSVDREIPRSELRPLTRKERKEWEDFRRRLGPPTAPRG